MLNLTKQGLLDKNSWEAAAVLLPRYDLNDVLLKTDQAPKWIHFGAGNIFRAFIAPLQQKLINEGLSQTGIIAVGTAGSQTFNLCYEPYDNLSLCVSMGGDGSLSKEVIANITQTLIADFHSPQWKKLIEIFQNPSLEIASFTITEKGYSMKDLQGQVVSLIQKDIQQGPDACAHTMAVAAAMLHKRYLAGKLPLALVSMDNCSKNGDKLKDAILFVAEAWASRGFVSGEFIAYLKDERYVSFPWTMIDKITPNPSPQVKAHLESLSLTRMEIIKTERGTVIAPFVNAEKAGYLIIEDDFAGGRPPLERAGVYFTDRETVEKAEKMKVGTCLNPLHTALAILGCLLGYPSIASEMSDMEISQFIRRMALEEGMPVVENPGILDPADFLEEVLGKRFPNTFIPDTPQRIATDTSQKIPVRFGGTLKKYWDKSDQSIGSLRFIPFVIAAWFRYLLGIDDNGSAMEVSPDPMLPMLREALTEISFGQPIPDDSQLRVLLSNSSIFGVDLVAADLADKIILDLASMIRGPSAVRKALQELLAL